MCEYYLIVFESMYYFTLNVELHYYNKIEWKNMMNYFVKFMPHDSLVSYITMQRNEAVHLWHKIN